MKCVIRVCLYGGDKNKLKKIITNIFLSQINLLYLFIKQSEIMTGQEIHKLANTLTEKKVNEVIKDWENKKDTKSIKTYKCLVSLGDSNKLACATVIADNLSNKNIDNSLYEIAYYS